MGTDLICLQVHIGEKSKTDFRESVIQSTRQHVLKEGYVETAPENHPYFSGMEIFIGPSGDSSWLTVLGFDTILRELAKSLSAILETTVVFISLIDSDVVHLRRYDNGKMVDEYCNAPHLISLYAIDPDLQSEWEGIDEDDLIAMNKGNLEHWRDLFVASVNPDDIRQIWDSDPVFADDILWATVEALGMNGEQMTHEFGDDQEAFTRLTFEIKVKHSSSQEKPFQPVQAEGPPKLKIVGHNEFTKVYVGQKIDLQIWTQNEGVAFKGLDIFVWGTAVDKNIVHFDEIKSYRPQGFGKEDEGAFVSIVGQLEGLEIPMLAANLEAFEFPHGVVGELDMELTLNMEMIFALSQTQVQFNFPLVITAEGLGEFFIAFVPHDNQEDDQTIYHASLESTPTPRQPLPSKDATRPPHPDELQLLASPDSLFGLVSLGTIQEQSTHIVASAFEDWAEMIGGIKKGNFVTYLRPSLNLKSKKENISAVDIPGSHQWEKFRNSLGSCVSFSIHHNKGGVLYDVSTLSFQSSNEEPAPQLMFYFVPDIPNEAEFNNVKMWLMKMMDQLMIETNGFQAIVGQWGWQGPPTDIRTNMTLYEVACSIGGQCTTARFWCQTFLRGVTPNLWLGQALLDRLGDRGPLESISTVVPFGAGVRVTLNEGRTLDDLEVAIDPLLARESDWRTGMRRLYPRKK